MRVLVLHSRYRSGSVSGETRVMEDEVGLLRSDGHDVRTIDPSPEGESLGQRLRMAASSTWSRSANRSLNELLRDWQPDVAHCHNLFPTLSPSVVRVLEDAGVPIVMTLHNFRLMCLPGSFLRDGKICELCHGRSLVAGVKYRCYRNSLSGSLALGGSLTIHRTIGTWDDVSLFLAVSDFLKRKHETSGLLRSPIVVKENFSWPAEQRHGPGDYFLYLGRLGTEKGIPILLEAFKSTGAPLVIAGGGPMEDFVRAEAGPNVTFLGAIDPDEAQRRVAGARAVVIPSTWYEGAPRSIVEAYASGVPVIASDIGGMSEFVSPEDTGVLVTPGDPNALADAIDSLGRDGSSLEMGAGAKRAWETRFSHEVALVRLLECYDQARGRAS